MMAQKIDKKHPAYSEMVHPSCDPYSLLESIFASIDSVELSVRTAYCLKKARIRSIGELIQKTENYLLGEGLGKKSISELKEILAEMGLGLGMSLRALGFDSKQDIEKYEFVGVGLFGNRLELVSLRRDGRFVFLDEVHSYGGIYIVTSETVALRQAVEELEALINDPATKEQDLQNFFERNPDFILNDEYKKAHPKVVLRDREDKDLIPDFVLEPYMQQGSLCDILDLKPHDTKVYVLKKNRPRFSAAVHEVCSQLREYAEFFEEKENRLKILDKYGLSVYKPKLFVIIGRRERIDPITKRRIERPISDVTVLTYDDIIDRIRRRLILKEKRVRN